MVDPLVEEHWPQLAALHRALGAIPDTISVPAPVRDLSDDDVDRIHEALLRKQRSGSLGLNE